MVEVQAQQTEEEPISDEEAILKIAAAMKDTPSQEEKQNVHTFLLNVVQEKEIHPISKIGNLRDDKEMNELGKPIWNVRGSLGMALIADKIMDNEFFKNYFNSDAAITLNTSLSREGFLIKQATVTTRQVADATKRRKINRGMFGKKSIEESGGDITSQSYQQG
jgi:hypothetical protein